MRYGYCGASRWEGKGWWFQGCYGAKQGRADGAVVGGRGGMSYIRMADEVQRSIAGLRDNAFAASNDGKTRMAALRADPLHLIIQFTFLDHCFATGRRHLNRELV